MIKVITSKNNDKIKYACSLKENKYRNLYHEFLGESLKSLQLAHKANLVIEIYTYEYLDNIDENIPQLLVNEEVMRKLSVTSNPEGVVFRCKIPDYKKDNLKKILYLDEINDPGNLGTLIRTALAFNFDAVVTSPKSVSIYNEKVLASAKGANYLIPVFSDEIDNIVNGHQLIVTTLSDDSIDLKEIKKDDNFVLVLGNEAHGVSKTILDKATVKVKIPIQNIDSINVAIAGGILMYELSK